MLNFKQMAVPQSVSAAFSAYASFATTMMLLRSLTNELLPSKFISFLTSIYVYFFGPISSSENKFVIEENSGIRSNEIFQAAEIYLRTKITPAIDILNVNKTTRQKNFTLSVHKDQEITDYFENIRLKWRLVSSQKEQGPMGGKTETRHFELLFPKKFRDRVVDFYLPYVLKKANEINEENKVVRIFSQECLSDRIGSWGSVNLDHPSTFDTLAMDTELKQWIIDDLDRFIRRKDFYRKVGKAWKRGYLLYGPPGTGTGKSSLIAAIANYLKFDIYDLDLSNIHENSTLRRILLGTSNRSILVIEDIDCTVDMPNRQNTRNSKFTLAGLLNFIDGLWSSYGDERIIIFTTNYKERLEPALLRPGRMDVHINMSYCSSQGLKVLASNYLGREATEHRMYGEIEKLVGDMKVSPAEIGEELMKGEYTEAVLGGLVDFLQSKREEKRKEEEEEEEGKKEKNGSALPLTKSKVALFGC